MARTPALAPIEYQRLVAMAEKLGYDPAKLRPVPQRWP
jgi:apolipoprotein D and lipocalin family protein